MSRAQTVVMLVRTALVVLSLCVGILVLGPFQGSEQSVGLNDKEAHVIAFFALTTLMLIALPKVRRMDIALYALTIGGGLEVAQLFTGRTFSIHDWLADAVGVSMAILPMMFESLRVHIRQEGVKPQPRRRANDRRAQAERFQRQGERP